MTRGGRPAVAHPRSGQPPGHRQHRERGAHRQELRDRAHAARGSPRCSIPGASRGSRTTRRTSSRGSRSFRRWRPPRGLRVELRADRPRACRQAADAAAPGSGGRAGAGPAHGPGRHRRGPRGQRAHQRRARSVPHCSSRSRPIPRTRRSIWRRQSRSWHTRSGTRGAGRRSRSRLPAREAEPATSGQLEELFDDWHRALWAIDFFKTRRSESVMRSFREFVFRADLDGREASLVRAMGIEVARYLQRVGAPRQASAGAGTFRGHCDGMTRPLERLLGGQPLQRRSRGAGPAAPLKELPAAAAAVPSAADGPDRARRRRRGGALHGAWRWAWEYGVGNRKLCWVHVIGEARRPPSP